MIEALELPFRALIEAAPDGMVVCDHVGVIVLVNAQTERMFGYPRVELIGQRLEILIPERYRAHHPAHVNGYIASPRARAMGGNLELHGRRRDGTEFPIEISLSPIDTAKGVVAAAAIRDVTDRRRIEAEARRANAYLVSAVDAIHDAFALYDEDDRVVMVNSVARQWLGVRGGAIIGRHFRDIIEESIDDGAYDLGGGTRDDLLARWLAYHQAPSGVFELRTSAGRHLRVIERVTPEQGTVSLTIDVTDDVVREVELRDARAAAEAASAAKSEFLASMSHELRTPLNAILGFAQLLERDRKQPLTERQLERLGHVVHGGEHLLRLIDDILDLARIEAGRIMISPEPVALRHVIDEVVSSLEGLAARRGVRLESPTAPSLPQVIADRTRITQILMNYGSNAIKYGRSGGRATFRIEPRPDNMVRILVSDDGIGIPADKRDRMFEPFQRAGQETGPIEGTGIGLAISKRLTELMHGQVGYTSVEGEGSEFWVDLPLHVTAPAAVATTATSVNRPSVLESSTVRRKIVYVEDNRSNIAFMRDLMEDFAGIELIVAISAELGLELIRSHRPDVVIMDINLPGMSGLEAVSLLRESPDTKDIPVIALSAAALVTDTARARDAGFYRYLTKPVKVVELTAVLEELLT